MKWDMYDAIFPAFVTISEALKSGTLPFWEPFQYRGVPISNLMGIPIWFPLTIILGIVGYTQEMMQFQYLVIILLAAWFMYLSLGNYVNNPWLCALGGIVYATSGQFVSNAQHITFLIAAMLFPLIHYATRKWIDERKNSWLILIGVSTGLLLLNNYPPFLILTALFIVMELVFSFKKIKKDSNNLNVLKVFFYSTSIVLIVAILVGFVSVYTNLTVMNEITRSHVPWESATASSLNIWNLLGVFSPVLVQLSDRLNMGLDLSMSNMYIAMPILLLAFSRVPKTSKDLVLLAGCVLALLLSMGQNSIVYQILYNYIPGMDTFKFPSGIRYIYFYYITLLAIKNLDNIIKDKSNFYKIDKIFSKGAYILLILTTVVILIGSIGSFESLIYNSIIKELFWSAAIIGMFVFTMNYKKNNVLFFTNLSLLIVIFATLGVWRNDEYTIGVAERPESYSEEIKKLYNLPEENWISNTSAESIPLAMARTVFTQNFQNGGYVGSFKLKTFNEAFENELLPKEGEPIVWLIEEEKAQFNESKLKTAGVIKTSASEVINYTPNEISGNLELDTSSYLILEQTYFNGWKVDIDEFNREIVHTDSGAIAVKVNPENTKFVFEFKPVGTIISIVISVVTWIILIGYGLYLLYKMKRRTKIKV
ncbi:hypothetical protein AEA09_17880 [Lysinibacillus contaminans]|uniref:Bacterial membrane protein YfhO n=1 Tax=Lysinibacillus contaminans TaxID=1293441 RepID=A0ABR5JXC0_9BACI|nr:YfhO family protein [Lysinibacillus contaminans]KOS66607.1 hypothetical protein AEA09_17880 [Lysinibacillus contaminans]